MNRPGASFTCGDTVTYTCNDGYEIQGEGTMTCGATGTWDNTRPLCVESKRNSLEYDVRKIRVSVQETFTVRYDLRLKITLMRKNDNY